MKRIFMTLFCCLGILFFLNAQGGKNEGVSNKVTLGKGTKSSTAIVPKKKTTTFIWEAPREIKFNSTEGNIGIIVNINTGKPITRKQIRVLRNGKDLGIKADVIKLEEKARESYDFSCKVQLKRGENNIVIVVTQDDEEFTSKPRIFIKKGSEITIPVNTGASGALGVFWKKPQWSDIPIVYGDRQFKMEVQINSNVKIRRNDIRVIRKGVQRMPFSADSKLTKIADDQYTFTTTIQLDEEGINDFVVKVNPQVTRPLPPSDPLEINFSPNRPNVFVLSIGVETNLSYTLNDARDFAAMYEKQGVLDGGRLYNVVNTETLIGAKATALSIKSKIEILKTKYKNKQIGKGDLIVIYLSSHGFLDEKRLLRIQGDDYDPAIPVNTSVSYQDDILKPLDKIPCKKLIFIDACYSGETKTNNEDIDYRIDKGFKTLQGFTTIVSSRGDEVSYEHEKWENGAFTEAIIEALGNGRADDVRNPDGLITIDELWEYLNQRVPTLVWKTLKKTQHPKLLINDLGDATIYSKY